MEIRLTANGKALVEMMRSEAGSVCTEIHRPRMKEYTLIRLGRNGHPVSQETILIDESRYFKAA